jgi:ABC-type multidrug transport system fused ATPase/permease subunit
MAEVSGKAFDFNLFKRVLRYAGPYKKLFGYSAILVVFLGALGTARPILVRQAMDNYILEFDGAGLLNVTLLLVALLVVESIFQFAFSYATSYLGQAVIRDIRVSLYEKLMKFRLSFFDKTPIGTLVTRTVSDIESIASIFSEGLLTIIGDLFRIAVMLVAMFWFFDWKLVLISLSVIPVLYYATRWFQINVKRSFQEVRNEISNLNAFVQEHIVGMSIVQLFNREDAEMKKFKAINDRHRKANIRGIWYYSIFFPIIEILSAISIGLAVWYGGVLAAKGQGVTIGDLTAMIIFINMLFRPLRQLADRFNTLQMGMVASERVFKLLENEEDVEFFGIDIMPRAKGEIVFKDVEFWYKEDEPVLRKVNFTVKPGERLAIVGATGAGKSTIISLLMGFYHYQKGHIYLDGHELKNLDLENLRSQFALVLQDVFLFSDTIYNNITMGEQLREEEVIAASKKIGVDEFVQEMPGQYNYNVKERGGMLSAGQRQLLSFLRAYITNPPILILDEATSSIDTHSEELIQHAIDVLTEGRTSIIIAHRLSTIQTADRILVMEHGQVVEQGTHEELLAKNGYYTRLYEMQFRAAESVN